MSKPKNIVESLRPRLPDPQLSVARAESTLLRHQLASARLELGRALDVRGLLGEAAAAIPAPRPPRPDLRRGRPAVSMLALWSDVHVGEWIDQAQTDGWGMFNYAIAEARTQRYAERLLRWAATMRGGYRIEEAHLLALGDMISGDIHEELSRSNEFPAPIQALLSGRLIAMLASALAGGFRKVRIHAVSGGNHGRLTRKPQHKQGALNNWDYVAYAYAAALLRGCPNVVCDLHEAKKVVADIDGFKFLLGHGDHVRAWMGLPYYGLARDLGREAERRLSRIMDQIRADERIDGGMDYGLGGHFHAPFTGPSGRYLINGSLSGTTELDHDVGRHAAPQQVSALLHKRHGLFGVTYWRLDDPTDVGLIGVRRGEELIGKGLE